MDGSDRCTSMALSTFVTLIAWKKSRRAGHITGSRNIGWDPAPMHPPAIMALIQPRASNLGGVT